MQDLYDRADATAVAAAIRDGDVTAEQVVEHAARRLEEHNPRLNAITQVRIEQALQQARAGLPSGPLTGVPFVIKDLGVDVAGMATTNGSRLFRDAVKEQDAELVRRYRRAGLVIVGKTNTPEFGKSASTEPLLYGPTRNPHDPTRSAGGSSGGTAAAIAGGIVPVGHGSDGGGSLRIPAAACGLVGLKPSRGRTPGPTRSGALSSPATVDHVIARSVRDTALLLDVAGGPVAGAGYAAPHRRDDYAGEVGRDPGRCRIAVTTVRPDGRPANEQMAAPTRTVAARLEALGHEVDEVAPVFPREALMRAFSVLMSVPMVVEIDARLAELGRDLVDDDLEPFTRAMYEHGRGRSGTEVVEALRAVEHCGRALGGFFEEHDALLTPTLAEPTPALGHLDTTDVAAMYERAGTYSAFTSVYNVTGQPAISLPLGHDAQGMPAGVQLVAAFGREDLLLRLASQLLADDGS